MKHPGRTAGAILLTTTVLLTAAPLALAHPGPAPAAVEHQTPTPRPTPGPLPTPTPSPAAPPCPVVDGWDCTWLPRFAAVAERVGRTPGRLSVVIRDRATGATWSTGTTTARTWTGSTIKLALATYALQQARAGQIQLTARDRDDLAAMLHVSDDAAADRIWTRLGRHTMLDVFRTRYAMTGLTMAGSNNDWGALACTADDLANLMTYVLAGLHPDDRAYLVAAMRDVDDIQHWGMWSAGPGMRPGVKNGWLENAYAGSPHWDTSTVGFAGPDERYVVAVMFEMPAGANSLELGARTLSDICAALFGGATPAPARIRPS